jgi:adenine-specific DNA-methyltransferase
MTSVFIGGSRNVSHLDDDVRQRLDRIIEKQFPVIIGDANGADKAVQTYLKSRSYHKVEVFCMEGKCRNNVGPWPSRAVPAPHNTRDFKYYAAKDQVMAGEASVGFMLWDGKSMGTLANVARLIGGHKKVVVYNARNKTFADLKSAIDWNSFLSSCPPDLQDRLEQQISGEESMSQVPSQTGSLLED